MEAEIKTESIAEEVVADVGTVTVATPPGRPDRDDPSWHFCDCKIVTKTKPKKSKKKLAREEQTRRERAWAFRDKAEAEGMDPEKMLAAIEKIMEPPPTPPSQIVLDRPCDYVTKNRDAMRVHLRTIHTVYYCQYCRTRWNAPQKQKWKEHKQKYPSGQCRYPDTGGMGPGKAKELPRSKSKYPRPKGAAKGPN